MQLLTTTDAATQALLKASKFEQRMERMAKSIRLLWPITNTKCIDAHKRRQKAAELWEWSQLPSKGKGVPQFTDDRNGNCCLYDPTLLKPSRYLTALRMRSGTTGDRITLNKAIPQATLKCRKCKSSLETMAHILGQCTYSKSERIRRHDEIRNYLAERLASNPEFQIVEEASIVTPSGTLKPDLVVIHQGRVQIVDVTVRYEDTGYLEEGHNSKITKYTPLLPQIATQQSGTGQCVAGSDWVTRSYTKEHTLLLGNPKDHRSWPP